MSLRRSRGGSRPRNFLRVCLALVARMCLTLVVLVASAPSNAGRVERGTDARIRLNTVGFIPGQEKRASVAARFTDFNVVADEGGVVVFRGKATGLIHNADTDEDLYVAGCDASLVRQVRDGLIAAADRVVALRDAHGYARPPRRRARGTRRT